MIFSKAALGTPMPAFILSNPLKAIPANWVLGLAAIVYHTSLMRFLTIHTKWYWYLSFMVKENFKITNEINDNDPLYTSWESARIDGTFT